MIYETVQMGYGVEGRVPPQLMYGALTPHRYAPLRTGVSWCAYTS